MADAFECASPVLAVTSDTEGIAGWSKWLQLISTRSYTTYPVALFLFDEIRSWEQSFSIPDWAAINKIAHIIISNHLSIGVLRVFN